MLFNSPSFLAAFLAFTFIYYAAPQRLRWVLLLVASLGFYASFEPLHVALLAFVSAVAYVGARGMGTARGSRARGAVLAASVVPILGTLFAFKYFAFFAGAVETLLGSSASAVRPTGVASVVGLSFYTFSAVSYLVDVHAGRVAAERHAGYFLLYVSFFPKLLAGPIERAGPFLAELRRSVPLNPALVTSGLRLMLWGLFKKVVVADRLASFVDSAYGQPALASPADLVLGTYFFAFQLYCDFSGYSDIAIGAARVLGLGLSVNFRRPYLAVSVADFWARRWHLSLTSWFRDYVYIPLGGNRVSRARHAFNILAVFLLSGLWHGANWTFIVWGALNGVYQVVSLVTDRWRRSMARRVLPTAVRTATLSRLVTFHLILVTWVFFRAASISDALLIFSRIAGSAGRIPTLLIARVTRGEVLLSLVLIVVLLGVESLDEVRPVWHRLRDQALPVRWAAYYAVLFSLIVFGVWNLQRFVYMQF